MDTSHNFPRWWSDCTANWRDKWTKVREIFFNWDHADHVDDVGDDDVRSFFKGRTKKNW